MTKLENNDSCKSFIEGMTLMNRLLFAEIIENVEFAEACLSIIMNDDHVLSVPPQAEKEIRNLEVGKYIRMDSFMQDERDNCFDLEVQKTNEYNLPRRSRHYQAMADSTLLESGESDPNSMNNMYVIIISSFDPYGKKRFCYQFANTCETVPGLALNDGGKRIFLNTKGKDDENVSEELKWMLRYFEETTDEIAAASGSRRIQRMNEIVKEIKASAEFDRKARARLEDLAEARAESHAEGLNEGVSVGVEKAHTEDARRLKARGIALDIIAECTGLPLATVEAM